VGPRCRTFPNGATAMRELAAAGTPRSIGCTQVTEIRYTEGVDLVGALPPPFELATVYTAASRRRSRAGPGGALRRAAAGRHRASCVPRAASSSTDPIDGDTRMKASTEGLQALASAPTKLAVVPPGDTLEF
jgi:hypothetical protein